MKASHSATNGLIRGSRLRAAAAALAWSSAGTVLAIGLAVPAQAQVSSSLRGKVTGDRDPGYGSTSRMVTEAALALLHDVDRAATPGGVWTAGAALGLALVRRLEAHAGLAFRLEEAHASSVTPRARASPRAPAAPWPAAPGSRRYGAGSCR